MGSRAIMNRIAKLKVLEEQKKAIEKQMEAIQQEIKEEMQNQDTEELKAGNHIVRWTIVISNRFDSKKFKAEHAAMYNRYIKATESRRFSIV